jgi:hypothetical protein
MVRGDHADVPSAWSPPMRCTSRPSGCRPGWKNTAWLM